MAFVARHLLFGSCCQPKQVQQDIDPDLKQLEKKMPLVKHKRREGRIAPTHTNDPTEVVVFYWLVLALFLL